MTGSLGAGAASSYPAEYDVDVTLRDGSTAAVRPIQPEDEPALAGFLATLSEQARWFHFFSAAVDLRAAARAAVDVEHRDRFGLVAFAGGRLVGHAQYGRLGTRPEAEVAFAVSDAVQGEGLATILLAHLAERASACGIHVLEAVVLRANHRMVEVFRDSGFPVRTRTEGDELVIELPASLSPQARSAFEQREGTAAVAAVRHVLEPASIVVIGASRHPGKVGRALVDNLGAAGFPGELWAVNPTATAIGGVPCFPTVDDLPGEPELAVVAVPAEQVVAIAERCAARGVKALVVVSAGFAEVGPEGARRQAELVAVCRRSGMRLVGPNCIGVANTDAAWPLDATFAPDLPPAGSVALMAQSGAVALTVIEAASERGIGLSSFVSAGNKADLSSNDFLRYWEQDDATRVVLLYLESFGNPRRFGRIAPRVARTKPVVAVKAGRSAAGAAASASHTGALVRASDVTVDALFRRAGVIRCDTLAEQLDVAGLLALAPEPRGRRVAVVTNAGGPAIMAADACAAHGLEVPALPPGLQRHLRSFLPAHAAVGNPVDLIATATPDQYAAAIEAVAAAGAADAIVAVFVRPLGSQSEPVLEALERAATGAARSLPVLAVMMSDHARLQARPNHQLPLFRFPEEAIRALGHAVGHAAWRAVPEEPLPELPGVRREEAARLLARAGADGERWLGSDELDRVLRCYGLAQVPAREAATPEEAGRAALELGGPVALKAIAPTLVHKSEAGAVRLSLVGDREVREAAEAMRAHVAAAGHEVGGFLVQAMAPPGPELLIGVVQDPAFGPVVACGAGGVTAELQHDTAVALAPLGEREAGDLLGSLRSFPLLEGYRSSPAADLAAVRHVLVRVAALADAH
ncbi:MAG TPA: GNAT family N-acetyltransferase, partial [Solirubrobacteraceae bacterium]|nr:GNAT family N-acetyltransferase [Solirubrobacteraceae bacterium]